MAKLGLLGAIGGVGKALETFGSDIVKRREQALEDARRLAREQSRDAQRTSEIKLTHDLDMEEIGARGQNAADLSAEQQAAMDAREQKKEAFTEKMQGRKESANEKTIRMREEGEMRLAKLRANLDAANDAASQRLKSKLDSPKIKRVEYGKPDKEGYAEVITVRDDGTTIHTGEHVYKPKLDYKEDDTDDDAL